jgi:two-component system chemotaxis response regulator CheV
VATGIAQCGTDLVTILDFEKIATDIAPETGIQMDEINRLGQRERVDYPILIAEDSVLLTKMIEAALTKAGYVNLTFKNNGQEAWDYLTHIRSDSDLDKKVSLIITDIEMPEMDGHRLTKLVKDDKNLQHIPLIIFSSMINEELMIKGKQLGADEQLSKPEIGHLVEVIDHLLQRRKKNG